MGNMCVEHDFSLVNKSILLHDGIKSLSFFDEYSE